jgi:uncharacterized membrane protein
MDMMEQITGEDRWRSRRAGSALAHLEEERGGVARAADGVARRTRFLGWFSIGLGLAQLGSPGRMSSFVLGADLPRRRRAMRLLGAREIACGIGILSRRRPSGWLWMRVLGDAMDLALLGASLSARRTDNGKIVRSMASVAGVMALDALTSFQVQRRSRPVVGVRRFTTAVTVNRPPEEVYRFWRNLQNLPLFMSHLESVHLRDDRRSRWVARGAGRTRIEWEAEITEDRLNERLSWRSVGESDVDSAGSVSFAPAPGGRGTEVILDLEYLPPGGRLGVKLARLFGEEPAQQAAGDLRRFKQVIETGEVLHSDASIHRGRHPARPPRDGEIANPGGRR